MAKERLSALKFDNKTIDEVYDLINCHCIDLICKRTSVKRWLNKLGEERYRTLLQVRTADIKAHSPESTVKLDYVQQIRGFLEEIIEQNQCFSLKDLNINGRDLIHMGVTNGTEIGGILKDLLSKVIDGELKNNKKVLLDYVSIQTNQTT